MEKNKILLIENNRADIETFRRAIDGFDREIDLLIKRDGISARSFLNRFDGSGGENKFDMVILDLNLPGIDGRKLLVDFFDSGNFKPVPVVVVTTSANARDISFAYENGANAYVIKPGAGFKFLEYIESIFNFWL